MHPALFPTTDRPETCYDPMAEHGEIYLYVPAVPVSQPRPRASNRHGFARVHEQVEIRNKDTGEKRPHPILAFKATVRQTYTNSRSGAPLDVPLYVKTVFVFPRPGNMLWKTKPMPRAPLATGLRSDGDNLTKAVWDALNGLAFRDDGQIAQWSGEKWIAAGDEAPHVEITLRPL